ncbi:MAG: hypothetical protein JOZ73_11590, partial [Solirubrobacterales bacterium]|nr:hypothetical protein [Solirubrobacterales bacterium]
TIRNELVLGDFVFTSSETGYALTTVLNDRSRADNAESAFTVAPEIASVTHLSPQRLTQVFPTLDTAKVGNKLLTRAFHYALAHPGYTIKAEALNVLRSLDLANGRYIGSSAYEALGVPPSPIWSLLLPFTYLVYALALLGAVVLLRRQELSRPPLVFYLVPLVLLLSTGLVAGGMRYRIPLDPVLLAFAGLALATLVEQLRSRRRTSGSTSEPSTLPRPSRVAS